MEMWYTEEQTSNVRFSIRCDKQKYSAQSDFQRIEIFSTPEFGDVLVLDDRVMLTQKDEFIYHEMITHVPMATNPSIKNVLFIGAGDGGTVKELTRYKTIENIIFTFINHKLNYENTFNVCWITESTNERTA